MSVCDPVFPLGYKLHMNRDAVSFVSAAPSVCRKVWHSVGAQDCWANEIGQWITAQFNNYIVFQIICSLKRIRSNISLFFILKWTIAVVEKSNQTGDRLFTFTEKILGSHHAYESLYPTFYIYFMIFFLKHPIKR